MARISTGTMTVGIFAVLFGLVGAYALRAALVGDAPPPPAAPATVAIPLAAHDLPAGRAVTMGDMSLVPMTRADMEKRGLPLETTMTEPSQIIGRVLHDPIKQGEAFFTTNLYPEGTGPKLSEKLKPGMRAVTIPIDNLAAVGGKTVEGSFVDVLFKAKSRPADPMNGRPEIPSTTVTLLENVEVLSVGRVSAAARDVDGVDVRLTNGRDALLPSGIVSVTIAVSPDQANIIKAVSGQGEMSLALRADVEDGAAATPNKYTLEGVLGLSMNSHGMDRIEIFRGGWGRQTAFYQNNKLVKNETSVIPGIAPSTPFPVPAVVPPATQGARPVDESTRPTPNFYQNNGYGGMGMGMGWGGGWGWGGWGRGAWGAGGTGATYGDNL